MNQTFSDFELIIVDDGSTDATLEILAELNDKRIRVIKHDVNKGVSSAKNTGLSQIKHEWFTILDSDDEMYPNALECFYNIITKHLDIEVITCNTVNSITKKYGGSGWSTEGRVDSASVLKYFYGEHWGIIKTSLIGDNKLNESLGVFEGIFWTKITWNKNRYFINEALRIYHTEGSDRISDGNYYSIEKNYRQYVNLLEETEYLALLKGHSLKMYYQYLTDAILAFIKYKDMKRAIDVIGKLNFRYIPIKKTIKIMLHLLLGTKMTSHVYKLRI